MDFDEIEIEKIAADIYGDQKNTMDHVDDGPTFKQDFGYLYLRLLAEEEDNSKQMTSLQRDVMETMEILPESSQFVKLFGDEVSLRLSMRNALPLEKEFDGLEVVVAVTVSAQEFRSTRQLPMVRAYMTRNISHHDIPLFIEHIRRIAQDFIETFYRIEGGSPVKPFFAALYSHLRCRLETLSEYCALCDKQLEDYGASLPIHCNGPLCSFQFSSFFQKGPTQEAFLRELPDDEYLDFLSFQKQSLILYESPRKMQEFNEKVRRNSGRTRFLFCSPESDWLESPRHPLRSTSDQKFLRLTTRASNIGQSVMLCEVVDDTSLFCFGDSFILKDLSSLRLRLYLQHLIEKTRMRPQTDYFLRRFFAERESSPATHNFQDFALSSLPSDVLLRIFSCLQPTELWRLRRVSRRLFKLFDAQAGELAKFRNAGLKIKKKSTFLHVELAKRRLRVDYEDDSMEGDLVNQVAELAERIEFTRLKYNRRTLKLLGTAGLDSLLPSLQEIRLKKTFISTLWLSSLKRLKSLRSLHLSECDVESLSDFVAFVRNLRELHICNGSLTLSEQELLESVGNISVLEIDGRSSPVTQSGLRAIIDKWIDGQEAMEVFSIAEAPRTNRNFRLPPVLNAIHTCSPLCCLEDPVRHAVVNSAGDSVLDICLSLNLPEISVLLVSSTL